MMRAGASLRVARDSAGVDLDAARRAAADLLGILRADPRNRAEFFALAGIPH